MASNPYEDLVEKPNPYVAMTEGPKSTKNRGNLWGLLPDSEPKTKAIIKESIDRGWGTGFPKAAYNLGGAVTDATAGVVPPEVAGGLGYLTNVFTQAIPSFLTSGRIGPSQSLLSGPSAWLMQNAVKPSVHAKDAPAALQTMLRENIYPTASGMEKISKITGGIDDMVTQAVANSPATVSVAAVGSRLREPHQRALSQVNPTADLAAVRNVWDEFVKSPLIKGKTEIPVKLAHELKRGTYQSLGGKVYGELSGAATEAQKALARGMREEVASKVPEIGPLLQRQSELLNAAEVAAPRAAIEANKNPLGLAALRMDDPKSAAAFWLDRFAALKAFLAMQAYHGTKPQVLVPFAMAESQAQNQPALVSP